MTRRLALALAGLTLITAAWAQDGIRRGTIKKVDAEKKTVTITVGGKDEELTVSDGTRLPDLSGDSVKERLAGLKEGTEVQFKAETKDGKEVLLGLRNAPVAGKQAANQAPPPRVDTSKFKSLPELGSEKYQGFEGGLYPEGKNERPKDHEAAGLALAKQVRPIEGKVVLLSVGMSNTTQEFSTFKPLADRDPDKHPALTIVDGAQGGMTAFLIRTDESSRGKDFWATVDQRLKAAGASREQVQIAWIKEADAGPSSGFPRYAQTLRDELRQTVQLMHRRFPNLKLVYLSNRTYGGYAKTRLNPEPYAYESGFAVKWLIEEQIKGDKELNFDPANGDVKAPWLSWGPNLWANGTTKNADGLFYTDDDFGPDGTHPTQSGRRKVAELLLKFFKTDSTAKLWFEAKK
jgi:Cu/Ag efflux protein CusF